MKLTHKLCGAVLLAAVGVAMAVPGITKADAESDKQFGGEMDIEFTRDTGEDTDTSRPDITDSSGGQDTEFISGTITRTARPVIFGIRDVTPLNFGKQTVVDDGSNHTYWAKNYEESAGVMVNNVLIKDGRLDVINHKYTVKAQITTPLTTTIKDGGKDVVRNLSGATLSYRNIHRKTNVAESLALPTDAVASSMEVIEGEPATFVNNTDPEKGRGESYIAFGKLNATGELASTKSVGLNIGKELAVFGGKYKGTVTWVMQEAN